MKKKLFATLLLILLPIVSLASESEDKLAIKKELNALAINWNQGDLEGVIKQYKQSDATTLIWSSKIIHGYQNIAAVLHESYPSKNDMGTLTTSQIKINLLSPGYALATGHWKNKNAQGKVTGGAFSMVYANTSQGWKVILDHGADAID